MICVAAPEISCTALDNCSAADASMSALPPPERVIGQGCDRPVATRLSSSAEVCCSMLRNASAAAAACCSAAEAMISAPFCASRDAVSASRRRRGDVLAAFGQRADLLAQLAERQQHGLALLGLGGGAIGGGPDHRGDRLDLRLYLCRQILRVERALLRTLSQRADLIGHHGESAAVIAGARRLDRGIERQQIGLVRDVADGLGDVADADRLRIELFDDGPSPPAVRHSA